MKKKLELIVKPKSHNRKEFRQTLYNLTENLKKHCSNLIIDESRDGIEFIVLAEWNSTDQMRKALRSEEFLILSGAVNALTEKTIIRHNDKQVSNNLLKVI